MSNYVITIDGMHCDNCVKRVEKALGGVYGVNTVSVSLKDNIAKLSGEVKEKELCEAIEELGFDVKEIKKS